MIGFRVALGNLSFKQCPLNCNPDIPDQNKLDTDSSLPRNTEFHK